MSRLPRASAAHSSTTTLTTRATWSKQSRCSIRRTSLRLRGLCCAACKGSTACEIGPPSSSTTFARSTAAQDVRSDARQRSRRVRQLAARQAVSISLGRWEDVLSEGLRTLIETGELGSKRGPRSAGDCSHRRTRGRTSPRQDPSKLPPTRSRSGQCDRPHRELLHRCSRFAAVEMIVDAHVPDSQQKSS